MQEIEELRHELDLRDKNQSSNNTNNNTNYNDQDMCDNDEEKARLIKQL